MNWQLLSNIEPQELVESRLQLHYAIQFIAATGAALAEPLPDYSHTSLIWAPDLKVFAGSIIRAAKSFRVALNPISFTLILLDQQGEPIAALPLSGKTMAEGLTWLRQEVSNLGAEASKIVFLEYPPDDFPNHRVAHGAAFNIPQALALGELVAYYANTQLLLERIIATVEDATAARIWPHHLDMATLIMLPGTKNGSLLTIGIGLSPGDTSYHEPYWYVSPYPYPDTTNLAALDGHGFWHTQNWVGAVLPASRTSENMNAETQQQQAEAFINSALAASIMLLKSDPTPV